MGKRKKTGGVNRPLRRSKRKKVALEFENDKAPGAPAWEQGKSQFTPVEDIENAPPNFVEFYNEIVAMRNPGGIASVAAVDSIGCYQLAKDDAPPKDRRFQILVGLLLSSQTRDEQTAAAVGRLHDLPGGCTVKSIQETDAETIKKCLYGVGFYNNKTKYLKKCADVLAKEYNYDIPDDLKSLVKLSGIGPKMAYLVLQHAWDKNLGIGVDVHVHRIANMMKWTGKEKTKKPEHTRKALEEWLPKSHWKQINSLLVGFGQAVCTPKKPKCSECLLSDRCPASSAKGK